MYLVLPKADWDHRTELAEHPGVERVEPNRLLLRVQAMTGRAHAVEIASVNRKLRSGSRVYVAALPGRESVLVQKESI